MDQRLIELERWDAAHSALREAVKRIKGLSGNDMYERAWQRAIERLQELDSELDREPKPHAILVRQRIEPILG